MPIPSLTVEGYTPGVETESSEVQELLRQLVYQARNAADAATEDEAEEEAQDVILEMELDGAHYTLVRSRPKSPRETALLSPREQEIARMVAEGYPNKTIAAVLDISSWTVGTHLRRIFAKLGVRTRAAMVARLLEDGLIKDHAKPFELRIAQLK